ncbi:MAG: hypothetical protein JW934_07490 [Anaerolineae bacterium]|nr:hypothetical protein [Anaerolineae bacterium]
MTAEVEMTIDERYKYLRKMQGDCITNVAVCPHKKRDFDQGNAEIALSRTTK